MTCKPVKRAFVTMNSALTTLSTQWHQKYTELSSSVGITAKAWGKPKKFWKDIDGNNFKRKFNLSLFVKEKATEPCKSSIRVFL